MLVKTAEPFYFPGNDTGCLLIHGLTGAPAEMRLMGEHLAGEGYTVLGVRLAGHGTRIEDMTRVSWEDWSNSVLDGWHFLKSTASNVFIIGLSLGGILALYHASFLPVAGVVGLSVPYQIEDPRLKILPLLSRLIPYIPKGESDWQDPHSVEDHFSYDFYPTKALVQLTILLESMRESLPEINAPALLVHAKKDAGIPFHSMDSIAQSLGTAENRIRKVALENSGHVVTRDMDKEQVFSATVQFIQDVLDSRI